MLKILIISWVFILSSFSKELTIAISDTNLGGLNQGLISSILSCSTKISEKSINIKSYPSLRGRQEFLGKVVDGYYPIIFKEEVRNNGLFPLYIDEVLLISLKGIDESDVSLGLVKGDNSQYLEKFKKFKVSFSVLNSNTLFKGLKEKRAEAIIVKRSELPDDFDLSNYDLKSLEYVESGIELNTSFYRKINMGRVEVRKRYSNCLEKANFLLEHKRRKSISNKIREDVLKIQKEFLFDKVRVSKIKKKNELWGQGPKSMGLVESVLNSDESKVLKKVLSKFNFVTEAFIFNHQGAVLGSLSKTSDYDQSDEEKFSLVKSQRKFSMENITDLYYDTSSGSFQIGIMIRVEDKKGDFSGGIYIGANINKILTHYKII